MKFNKYLLISILLIVFSSSVFAKTIDGYDFPDFTCDGEYCYIDDSQIYIKATENSFGTIDLYLKTKTYTGNVNLGFLYDRNDIEPDYIGYYNPHTVLQDWYDDDNYLGQFETPVDFTNLNKLVNTRTFNFDGKNTLKYITNLPVTSNVERHLTIHFKTNSDTPKSKYDIIIYPSFYGSDLVSALNNGHFYLLDPYVQGTNVIDKFDRSDRVLNGDTADNGNVWTCSGATAPTINDKRAELRDTGANPQCDLSILQINSSTYPYLNLSINMSVTATSAVNTFFRLRDSTNDIIQIRFDSGNIQHYNVNTSTYDTIQAYTAETNYTIVLKNINFTAQEYDIQVLGGSSATGYSFQNTATEIDTLRLIMATGITTVYGHYDDIIVNYNPPTGETYYTITSNGALNYGVDLYGHGDNQTYENSETNLGITYLYFNISGFSGDFIEYNSANGTSRYTIPSPCFTDPFEPYNVTVYYNSLNPVAEYFCRTSTTQYNLGTGGDTATITDQRIEFTSKRYNTSTGTINTEIPSNYTLLTTGEFWLENFTLSKNYTNLNASRDFQINFSKLVINATDYLTGNIINNINVNISYTPQSWFNYTTSTIGEVNFTLFDELNYTVNITSSGYIPQGTTLNFTGNSTHTFILQAFNSVYLSIYNATSLGLITDTVNILFEGTGNNTYSNTTTTGQLLVFNLTPDTYTVTISATGFQSGSYSVTVGNNTFQTLNAYLTESTANNVVFTFQDLSNNNQLLQDVTFTTEKFINSSYILVDTSLSDISGRVQVNYETGARYRFTATKTNYNTKQFVLDPIIFTEYTIRLQNNISIINTDQYNYISLVLNPQNYYANATNNFTMLIASPAGELIFYNYSVVLPNGTSYTDSGTNSQGESFSNSIYLGNFTSSQVVTLYYSYQISTGQVYSYTRVYPIISSNTGKNLLIDIKDNTFGIPLYDRVVISIIVAIFSAAIAYWFAGLIGSGAMSMFVLSYMAYTQFIPFWIAIPSILSIFGTIAWGSRQ